MRHIAYWALAAAAPVAMPLVASAAPAPITVVAPPVSLSDWSTRFARVLDRHLVYPMPVHGRDFSTGVVSVKFLCTETGTPMNVAIAKSSGSHDLDRAALEAVSRIATLHPLPDGVAHDQGYVAEVLFATNEKQAERLLTTLRRDAEKNNAWFPAQQQTAARSFVHLASN